LSEKKIKLAEVLFEFLPSDSQSCMVRTFLLAENTPQAQPCGFFLPEL
jgi:hypothetical protein